MACALSFCLRVSALFCLAPSALISEILQSSLTCPVPHTDGSGRLDDRFFFNDLTEDSIRKNDNKVNKKATCFCAKYLIIWKDRHEKST